MSQQSLASKTITKRNVAQSSVIFSVVVAVVTLGVIASVAYVDITENNNAVSIGKSIPELIASQKLRSEESRKHMELLSQADDLVKTLDKRVDDLNQLDEKVKKVNDQLNFIAVNLKTNSTQAVMQPSQPKIPLNVIKAVQAVPASHQLSNQNHQKYINAIFSQNHATKINSSHHMNAEGEAYLEFSWLFKARGSTSISQHSDLDDILKTQSTLNSHLLEANKFNATRL